ncbi:Peroxisomal membrane protein PMP47A [Golovinomyces cichoracearum]|uniref:Peroxisomal membrane protein PMP47A n=1 Tax=Golovinomyces cichoracearum TaxID=62708 RepID=A0A420HGA2_9PEZI|nr:Peroxisomal membrane protein PMP47A [Golovinomyces cichoracearum]
MASDNAAINLPSDNLAHAVAGAGGGIMSMALTYPLITLSTRAQVESSRANSNFIEAAKRIVRREGGASLYAGLDSALFGISVTNFVYYYWYEFVRAGFKKSALLSQRASKSLTTLESITAGAIAGSATVLLTNPIWVINTRMATINHNKDSVDRGTSSNIKSIKISSTFRTLVTLIREEGPQALFAGVIPALILVLNPILQYTIFEQLKNILARKRKITPTTAFLLGALGKLIATSITYPYITLKSRMHVAGRDGKTENMRKVMKNIIDEEGYKGLYKGIGPKVAQSVLTAAFLFAFKDIIYGQTVKIRRKMKLIS